MNVIQAFEERRSINFFDTERTVPEATLEKLLNVATLTPSSMNLQPWEVLVVNDPEKKTILRKYAFDQPKIEDSPATLIMIANPHAVEETFDNVFESWLNLGYVKPEQEEFFRNIPKNLYSGDNRKLFAVKNTAFYAMSIMIVAKGLGLETHPIDGFDEESIKKSFNIPEEKIIPLIISIGYLKPGQKLLPRAYRKPLEKFVKYNNY